MKYTIEVSHESASHKRSSNRARAARRAANPAQSRYKDVPTEFVCIDGEGVTLHVDCCSDSTCKKPDGPHVYVLLGVGDQQITNPEGLTWYECFEFLWSQFRTGSVAYTGFFLGYDFVQMLSSLSEERARMLLSVAGRAARQPRSDERRMPFPVRCGQWEFDILGTKRLKIRKHAPGCDLMHCSCKSQRWMHICDTGSFFQRSFLKVISPAEWSEPVVSQDEYDTISIGKAGRSSAVLDSNMLHYNALENQVLSRVLCSLNDGFRSLGIYLRPNQWFGPGQAAQTWLGNVGYLTGKELRELVPSPVLEAARCSYYGGWFELMMHGLVPGITHEYDINSAYPYIISKLPCWQHGKWRHGDRPPHDAAHVLVRADVSGSNRYIGTMLHRDDSGNISRPRYTAGWYWQSELSAAVRAGLASRVSVHECWWYEPCDCPPPLAQIAELYALRQRVGKNTPLGMAIKLLINSIYGKFAQSIGTPKYGNPLNASLITSGTREMILDAISTHPGRAKAVAMVATDGVYFTSPHPDLPISNRLGQWDTSDKSNMLLFKPGVYWDDKTRSQIRDGEAAVFKARGVNARDFSRVLSQVDDEFFDLAFNQPAAIDWPWVEFPLEFSMVSAVQALARGKWELAGTLVDSPTAKQSSNPILKRENWYWDGQLLRSRPPANASHEPSRPYQKRFGMEDPWSQESMEAAGILPEGYPGDLIKEILYD